MGLNKVNDGSNMYQFVSHTKNYAKGKCYFDCKYCYMKRWGEQQPVRFDEKEINEDMGEDKFIFVGSSIDLFAPNIPHLWIMKVLEHCRKYPKNKYLFQSKNPKRFYEFLDFFPEKTVLGTTLETNLLLPDVSLAPAPIERIVAFKGLPDRFERMITIEPIQKFSLSVFLMHLRDCQPKWVNVGANTSNLKLQEPSSEEVKQLVKNLRALKIDVKLKKNLERIYKEDS
jgi:protein gp37